MIYYLMLPFRRIKTEILPVPSRTIALLFFVVLFLLPLMTQDAYILYSIIFVCIFAIYAASWDFLSGITGQLSFGHAAFFGVAGYTSALLNLHFGWPVGATVILGGLVGVLIGLIIGLPSLKLRGTYFTLASLAFPVILMGVVYALAPITGGELGISGISSLTSSLQHSYYVVVTVLLASALILWKIGADSKIGIVLSAIAQDEIAARASGINTTRYKLSAFCASGFVAGISGGMYVHMLKVCGPSVLEIMLSFNAVIWTIFGGIGTIYGAIAGVFILYPLTELLHDFSQIRTLIYAVIIIVILFFMPEGIAKKVRDIIEKECPRCKERTALTKTHCRICGAELHSKK